MALVAVHTPGVNRTSLVSRHTTLSQGFPKAKSSTQMASLITTMLTKKRRKGEIKIIFMSPAF